jgi:dTDP-4-dehydrorhamnose 3,5-epimerase
LKEVELGKAFIFSDARGEFVKYNHPNLFQEMKTELKFCENFYSKSTLGSIRGFHIQSGHSENYRVIHVLQGVIFDVLVDLRINSKTFGKFESRILDASQYESLLIPPGVGHGFQTLSESIVLYASTEKYDAELDLGIHPLKDFDEWPIEITEISERDLKLPKISEYLEKKQK